MVLVGAAFCHHLYLAACRAVEVRTLIAGVDAEFLDAFDWRRNDARGRPARGHRVGIGEARRVNVIRSRHVVGDVAAIEQIRILIVDHAGRISVGRHRRLESGQRGGFPADVREHQ